MQLDRVDIPALAVERISSSLIRFEAQTLSKPYIVSASMTWQ